MLLSRLVPPAELRNQLRDLIAKLAFIDAQPNLRDRSDFDVRTLDSAKRISIATQEVATWLPPLAEQYQALRLVIESAPGPWKEIADDISRQIAALTADDFLRRVAWDDLKQYPRYLQAARVRWDKLRSGGVPKDRRLREPIDRLLVAIDQRRASLTSQNATAALQTILMLIEELRVSIFAQQLGTRQSVSPKRIEDMLKSLETT